MNLTSQELEKILKDNPDLSTETAPAQGDYRKARGVLPWKPGDPMPEELLDISRGNKPSKYGNVRTDYNGKIFPSKKEAKTARDLDLLQKAGSFDFYLSQVNFPLKDGTTYRADFVTFKFWSTGHNPGCSEPIKYGLWIIKVVEPKGYETREWKRKLRLFRESYPNLEIEVI